MRLVRIPAIIWMAFAGAGTVAAIAERLWLGCCDLYIGTAVASLALFVFAQLPLIPTSNMLASLGEKHAGDIYIFHPMMITILNAVASITGVVYTGVFVWLRPVAVLTMSMGMSCFRRALKTKVFGKC